MDEFFKNRFGREFLTFEAYSDYVKSLTPSQVKEEAENLEAGLLTIKMMIQNKFLTAALVHIACRWADKFNWHP